ncbi:hypothetical protein RHSIM_Rhsim04G0128000 [Rhododendron simsii]|uniref:RNase H type-1 domain-containing protein n=1 Tax=Rhododendron simsii TaxID=118357 RepID=A0A834LM91_RHOSS|nr:hypothetical protein RHSIM_Rhsim04G0128000 [Rhododendron simsii]
MRLIRSWLTPWFTAWKKPHSRHARETRLIVPRRRVESGENRLERSMIGMSWTSVAGEARGLGEVVVAGLSDGGFMYCSGITVMPLSDRDWTLTIGSGHPELEELPKEEPKPWVVQVDGSTTREVSGAWLILTSPKGQRLRYGLWFEFKATNNEVEYEALVVGLELANAIGVKHLLAKSDSQLVVGQVLGEYTVKEEVMQKYLDKGKTQVAKLQSFNIVRIPREDYIEVDYLEKLAIAKEDAIPRNAPVRYLELPSIFALDV